MALKSADPPQAPQKLSSRGVPLVSTEGEVQRVEGRVAIDDAKPVAVRLAETEVMLERVTAALAEVVAAVRERRDVSQGEEPLRVAGSVTLANEAMPVEGAVRIDGQVNVTQGSLWDVSGSKVIVDTTKEPVRVEVTNHAVPLKGPMVIEGAVGALQLGDWQVGFDTSSPMPVTDNGGSLTVDGDFYPATQPVSIADPVAVTGDFYQATQPVSGTVSVDGVVSVDGSIVNAQQAGAWSVSVPGIATEATLGAIADATSASSTATTDADGGVPILAERLSELTDTATTIAAGRYAVPRIDDRRAIRTNPEYTFVIEPCESATGWAAFGEASGLATSTNHIIRTAALTFTKSGTGATIGGIEKTFTTFSLGQMRAQDLLKWTLYVTTTSGLSYVFIRLGTDSSNYNEWRVPVSEIMVSEWCNVGAHIGDSIASVGNGWNSEAISYMAIGLATTAAGTTFGPIVVDNVAYHSASHVDISSTANMPLPVGMRGITGVMQHWPVSFFGTPRVSISGYDATYSSVSYQPTLSNTKTAIKASAGWLNKVIAENPNTVPVYIQLHNALVGSVTIGTTAPTDVVALPPGSASAPSLAEISIPRWLFNTGLTVAVTTTRTGSTAPGAVVPTTFHYE